MWEHGQDGCANEAGRTEWGRVSFSSGFPCEDRKIQDFKSERAFHASFPPYPGKQKLVVYVLESMPKCV